MVTLYGIANCDTVKKARVWLDGAGIVYHFHDVRKDGLTSDQVESWVSELGWETVVNRRSATWRCLPDALRSEASDDTVVTLILDAPTLIKRPLLDDGRKRHVGFSEAGYRDIFS